LIQRFKIPVAKLENFIMKVRDGYRDNPYHNFRHAFDVTQTVYATLTTMVCIASHRAVAVAVVVVVVAVAVLTRLRHRMLLNIWVISMYWQS
jgi:hypothetical protein